uniref:Nudix hydrolase domain-containing protein n=1 Tax=viral metagenome TaxID=1070528 RepID=A0A6C0M1T4_9ZZZZ
MAQIRKRRAGVVPFTFVRNEIYLLFGVDRKTQDYSDFGGGVKKQESFQEGALREFQEETCMSFSSKEYDLRKSIVVKLNDMAMFFVHVNPKWVDGVKPTFESRVHDSSEMSSLVWIKWSSLCSLVFCGNSRMWDKIREFLRKTVMSDSTFVAQLHTFL